MKISKWLLLIAFTAILAGCDSNNNGEKPQFKILVSQFHNPGGLIPNVQYNGMVNETTFSLSTCYDAAVNNYYPVDSGRIHFCGTYFDVIEVTKTHIILKVSANQKPD